MTAEVRIEESILDFRFWILDFGLAMNSEATINH